MSKKKAAFVCVPDIVISMGCDVGCPYIGREFDDNWGLPDPTGGSEEVFMEVIAEIRKRILELKAKVQNTDFSNSAKSSM